MTIDPHFLARLTDLEIHVAHQDQTIEDLSDVVRRQSDEIRTLRRGLERQTALIREMEGDQRDAPPAERPPPHY